MRKKSIYLCALLFWILLATCVFLIARADLSENVIQEKTRITDKNPFSLYRYLVSNNIGKDSIVAQFPYQVYLDSANIWSAKAIKRDIAAIDSFTNFDKDENRVSISRALTTELGLRSSKYLATYCADSLLRLIQWTEKFKACALVDADNELVYESIYNYWMDTITNSLSIYSYNKPSIKYSFKFRYLVERCIESRFVPPIKITNIEKGIDNLIYANNIPHFINAAWTQTSLLQKIVFGFVLIITLFGYICIIKYYLTQKNIKK